MIETIIPALRVDYKRITLVNRKNNERLTLDTNLSYMDNSSRLYPVSNLVIAELKQKKLSHDSPFARCFKEMRITRTSFSKYCMGVALTDTTIKKNRFKKKILQLQKFI